MAVGTGKPSADMARTIISTPQSLRDRALRDSFGELKLGAKAHSSGEINLPSSQPMLISHWRRKQCYGFALPSYHEEH